MNDPSKNASGQEKDRSLGPTFDANTEAVQNEMEALAQTFQRELDKTRDEAGRAEREPVRILIQELEDIPRSAGDEEERDGELPEEELCACCGEKRRASGSLYCSDCDDGLRRYPFDFLKIFFAAVLIALVLYSGYVFAGRIPVFSAVHRADALAHRHKMSSALNAYAQADELLRRDGIDGELVYAREIGAAYSLGYMDKADRLGAKLSPQRLKLPHLRKTGKLLSDTRSFFLTAEEVGKILNAYDDTKPEALPYDEIVAKLKALETAPVPEAAGKFPVKPTGYNRAMLLFYRFHVSSLCGKDLSVQLGFLEKIREEYPQYVWMYGAALGDLYARSGKDVSEIVRLLREADAEDASADVLQVRASRIRGDLKEAIAKCEELTADESFSAAYELLRQEALCYLAKGEYKTAFEKADAAYRSNVYAIEVVDTLALCAAAVGDEETYTRMKTLLEQNGYALSEEVVRFREGTLSIDDILGKGDYDVE